MLWTEFEINYRFISYWLSSHCVQFDPRHAHQLIRDIITNEAHDNCNRLSYPYVCAVRMHTQRHNRSQWMRMEWKTPPIDAGCRAHRIRVARFHWCHHPNESHIVIVCVCVYVGSLVISIYNLHRVYVEKRHRFWLLRCVISLSLCSIPCWALHRRRVNETNAGKIKYLFIIHVADDSRFCYWRSHRCVWVLSTELLTL